MEKMEGDGNPRKLKTRKRTVQERYKISEIAEELREKGNLPITQMRKIITEASAVLRIPSPTQRQSPTC